MAKRDRLALSAYQSVETYRDASGRCFIAYSNNASVFIRETRELIRFLRIAKGLPMRESLDSWLASLADMDAARQKPSPKEGLSDELLATGFGPEVHEEEDPTANTKMIT
ncbi:MAG: hypothetical protein LW834_12040 [Cyanobium sp. 49614_E6]|jgi:hypothetical protein|nr:hypothetical protein [Cyanobium sp. 49614_E6]MCE2837672.1 hypothetical protein [Cyanobium sp. 49614_E6]